MKETEQFERVTLDRLRALEKKYSRLLWILALVAAAVMWREVAFHPEVRADRFYLLDDAGRVRGMWRVRDNRPALILRDEAGIWKTILSVSEEGGELRLVGTGDKTSVDLAAGPEQVAISLRSGPEDAGLIRLHSNQGTAQLDLARAGDRPFVLPPENRPPPDDGS
jgi:hypothetical protein